MSMSVRQKSVKPHLVCFVALSSSYNLSHSRHQSTKNKALANSSLPCSQKFLKMGSSTI